MKLTTVIRHLTKILESDGDLKVFCRQLGDSHRTGNLEACVVVQRPVRVNAEGKVIRRAKKVVEVTSRR